MSIKYESSQWYWAIYLFQKKGKNSVNIKSKDQF